MTTASAGDYRAAVGAALAANDLKDSEIWLRFGLDQYPQDAQMLKLAARFEMARGDSGRAAEYLRASLAAMPPEDPGAGLAEELAKVPVAPRVVARKPAQTQPQDLATLLSQPDTSGGGAAYGEQAPVSTRPYLPGSPVQSGLGVVVPGNNAAGYGASPYGSPATAVPNFGMPATGSLPSYNTVPNGNAVPAAPGKGQQKAVPQNTKLKDYVPQAKLDGGDGLGAVIRLHPDAAMENVYGPYAPYDPSVETPVMALARETAATDGGLHNVSFEYLSSQQQTTADGTPIVPYASTAKKQAAKPSAGQPAVQVAQPVTHNRTPSAAAKARAAAIHANQEAAPEAMTGVSHPPVDTYSVAPPAQLDNAQYTNQGSQVQQPQQATGAQQLPVQTGDSQGQQYPQPTRGTVEYTTRGPVKRKKGASAPVQQTQQQPATPPIAYPTYGPPLSNPGLPQTGAPYPLPPAPTDSDLVIHNIPPLRGYYDPRIDPKTPLTDRQQAIFDLETLEGAYSGWLGGSVNGRYRSGTPGIDRLSALEVPFEASTVIGKSLRITVVPKAVFLNSGILVTTGDPADTHAGARIATSGNAVNAPQQQFASGIGGELQIQTSTLGAAIGYTPYQFLVGNVIGRVKWRPNLGHFTFYGGRDAVTETQLSYAGLRDPGSATTTFGGNVWGGVVQTGGWRAV